jgi:hypothetical protein
MDAISEYPQVVQRAFARHIQAHNYNAEQIRFIRSVQEVFLAKRALVEADLYDRSDSDSFAHYSHKGLRGRQTILPIGESKMEASC